MFLMQASPYVNKPFWASVVRGKSRRMTRLLPLSNHSLLSAGSLSGCADVFAILSDQKNKRRFGCGERQKAVSKGESLAGYDIWTHLLPAAGLIQWRCVLAMCPNVSLCEPEPEAVWLVERRRKEISKSQGTVGDACWWLELHEGK